jgi:predicted phage-related endonuclease
MVLKKLSSFRRKKFNVEGGAYVEAMVCSDCVDLDFDLDEIERSIKDGWEATWRQEGRNKKEVKQLKKHLPKLERKK